MTNQDCWPTQKFIRGDLVFIAEELCQSMRHFECGEYAVVLGSYRDLCRTHDKIDDWSLLFFDGRETSWYHTDQLEKCGHVGELGISRIKRKKALRDFQKDNEKSSAAIKDDEFNSSPKGKELLKKFQEAFGDLLKAKLEFLKPYK